ncbi:Ig-like domain-containing protein [Companilactobacillus sp. FL22-1]|uniref:Ig-like domain-containing protein n=1 Tax=Companilactobacillus sp. FL22-1 TaxID=3373892 RepID=UPI00375532A5
MKRITILVSAIIASFLLVLVSTSNQVFARDITEVVGLDSNSAVISDSDGQTYEHNAELPESSKYTLNYQWSIPNGVKVSEGDTLTFGIPDNVQITSDRSFPMLNSLGVTIGTITVKKGAPTGTVVLNGVLPLTPLNRKGFIRVGVNGTTPETTETLSQIILNKSAAWVDPDKPTTINWEVNVFIQGSGITDPTFVDTLGPNHTYVDNSAKLLDNRGFPIPITVTKNGNTITVVATGSFVGDMRLVYQSTTNEPTGEDTFTNQVTMTDQEGHSETADSSVDRPAPPVIETPGTEQPGTENPGTEQPGTEQPGTENPGTENPGTEQPVTEQPGTENPGTEQPGTEQPGTENPGTEQPGTEQPGTEQPSTEKPGTELPSTEKPGTEQPSTEKPGTEQPSTEKPGTEQPSTEKPGTEQPSTEKPGTEQPSTEKPGTEQPVVELPNAESPYEPGPLSPNKPSAVLPSSPALESNNATSNNDYSSQKFPQTGDKNQSALTLLGLVLLVGTMNVVVLHRRRMR